MYARRAYEIGRHMRQDICSAQGEYIDADVSLELPYQAGLLMTKENMANVDNLANDMHQRVLARSENINNG